MAITITGTPAQAPKLIASAEDGLFSRFMFYAYKNEIQWQDPSPQNRSIIYNDHFDKLADLLLQSIEFLEHSPTEILLSADQWDSLNSTFRSRLSDVTIFTGEDAASIVFRLGLITFRLCMIFSALRKVENAEMSDVMYCTQADFNNALMITQTYLQHNILMFNNLPKQNDRMEFLSGDGKRKLFDALPEEFSRKEAVETGKKFSLGTRTIDEMLKTSIGKNLTKIKSGTYLKC